MRTITVTEKHKAVNEGRMSKSEFVRQMRQSYPMYISPQNGYDATVQILKNKQMLFEEKEYEVDDTFPTITSRKISSALTDVSYSIFMNQIDKYEISKENLLLFLNGTNT